MRIARGFGGRRSGRISEAPDPDHPGFTRRIGTACKYVLAAGLAGGALGTTVFGIQAATSSPPPPPPPARVGMTYVEHIRSRPADDGLWVTVANQTSAPETAAVTLRNWNAFDSLVGYQAAIGGGTGTVSGDSSTVDLPTVPAHQIRSVELVAPHSDLQRGGEVLVAVNGRNYKDFSF